MRDRHPHPASPAHLGISRRAVMKGAAALLVAPGFVPRSASAATPGAGVDWYLTTASSPWQKRELAA